MYPIEFQHVRWLVRQVADQLVARLFSVLQAIGKFEDIDTTDARYYLADGITDEIAGNWRDLTTAHQAENAVEEMYNAARTELIKQLHLEGGTVEFGPGDVQPLTDQRLGQGEAWDAWLDEMMDERVWEGADDPRS